MKIKNLQELMKTAKTETGEYISKDVAKALFEFGGEMSDRGEAIVQDLGIDDHIRAFASTVAMIVAHDEDAMIIATAAEMDAIGFGSTVYTFALTLIGALVESGYLEVPNGRA